MSPEQIEVERKAFEASLKTMPEWAPEFESHRAWVEQYAFFVWLARAEKAQRVRDALEALDARLRECLKAPISAAEAYDSFYQEMVADALKD